MAETYINVPIPTRLFLAVADYLKQKKSKEDPVEAIKFAIEFWMKNGDGRARAASRVNEIEKGYWWKEVFLPHGTALRMRYKGNYFYAKIEQDSVVYEGKIYRSPSKIANEITNSSRNAWRDFEIKRPEDKHWNLAKVLRREGK